MSSCPDMHTLVVINVRVRHLSYLGTLSEAILAQLGPLGPKLGLKLVQNFVLCVSLDQIFVDLRTSFVVDFRVQAGPKI